MAVDEDRMAVDETQEKQEQQKEEEEECEDSEEEDSEVVFGEDEDVDVDDIYMLLKPFTRKQLYDLSKDAFEKHHCGDVDGVVYKACRMVARYGGEYRPPLDLQFYRKEERTMEECEKLVWVNRREATWQKLLEVFGVWELEAFVRICVNKLPVFADYVRKQADENPAHKTILVRSLGFGWDATHESQVSEFANYGDIAEIYYNNNHVTDDSPKINCCARTRDPSLPISGFFWRWRWLCL